MWSATAIEGPPLVLLVDASRNVAGWESEVCSRLFTAMTRRGIKLLEEGPLGMSGPDDLKGHLESLASANCILLLGHGGETMPPADVEVRGYWDWLRANVAGPKLFVCCSWESYGSDLTEQILKVPNEFAPIAIAQQSPVTAREGALFFLKFFIELHLHSEEQMTARMAWFSWSKAKELLKRRRLQASFGLRT